jgi:hypothetical protein
MEAVLKHYSLHGAEAQKMAIVWSVTAAKTWNYKGYIIQIFS